MHKQPTVSVNDKKKRCPHICKVSLSQSLWIPHLYSPQFFPPHLFVHAIVIFQFRHCDTKHSIFEWVVDMFFTIRELHCIPITNAIYSTVTTRYLSYTKEFESNQKSLRNLLIDRELAVCGSVKYEPLNVECCLIGSRYYFLDVWSKKIQIVFKPRHGTWGMKYLVSGWRITLNGLTDHMERNYF